MKGGGDVALKVRSLCLLFSSIMAAFLLTMLFCQQSHALDDRIIDDGTIWYITPGDDYVYNDEIVGYQYEGEVRQDGGRNRVENNLIIGDKTDSRGRYSLRHMGNLEVGGATIVGSSGRGSFANGGFLNEYSEHTSVDLYLGVNTGGDGYYALDDNGVLDVSYIEYIGFSGTGYFRHSSNGTNRAGYISIGTRPGSSGLYWLDGVSGCSVSANEIYVGLEGSGTFFHKDALNAVSGTLYLGFESTGYGLYELGSGGTLTAYTEIIGDRGPGQFTQSEGSTNTVNTLKIGEYSTGRGVYWLNGGTLSAGEEFIRHGYLTQYGGVNNAGFVYVGTNDIDETARYYLHGGELNAGLVTVGWGDTLTYSGGTLNANLVNYGLTNYLGAGEPLVHNGEITNYPYASLAFTNTEAQTERANVEINGNINNRHDADILVYRTNLEVNGDLENFGNIDIINSNTPWNSNENNYGTINVINSEVQWGTFTNYGTYISDMSLNNFEDLFIQEMGYLIGGDQDNFFINGDFTNRSTQYQLWDTLEAYLRFEGGDLYDFHNLVPTENARDFAWGTMEVVGGGLNLYGTDVYLYDLILGAGSDLILDGLSLSYYNLADYGGTITLLNGAELNQVPEPATLFLLGMGLIGLAWFSRRKFRQ
jgi:hypothetical protein